MLVRVLTGDGWREDGEGCLRGDGLRAGDGLRLCEGDGLRLRGDGAAFVVVAVLYRDVISMFRILRTGLTFSIAGGKPP